jgi:hypothetical protein
MVQVCIEGCSIFLLSNLACSHIWTGIYLGSVLLLKPCVPKTKQGVCQSHCGLAIYIKKYLKAKKEEL